MQAKLMYSALCEPRQYGRIAHFQAHQTEGRVFVRANLFYDGRQAVLYAAALIWV